jgi:hypothetical protein
MTRSSGRPWRSRKLRAALAVDLEALVLGAVALDEADVVEHRADVEQLGVVVQAELLALQRAPEEHPPRVVEQQLRGDVVHELGRLASERAVGDRDPGDGGADGTHAIQHAGAGGGGDTFGGHR